MRLSNGYWLLGAAQLVAATPVAAQRHEHGGAIAAEAVAPAEAYARGLYLLHNFEYDRARAAFVQARVADPTSVMAAWGEAMTHNHPLWMAVDKERGRSALARLGVTPAERRARARTDKERMWLDAVESLYAPTAKIAGDVAYNRAMEAMFARFPDDVDVRSFAALSVMGLAHKGREISLYMRAAAMLEEVFPTNLKHPGVLHYLIHAYDDPDHAALGLRAARLYGAVAPDAGHAMHMTSHIYLALGRWDEVEKANVLAMTTVNAQRAAGGRPATACGHYEEWRVYALLQQGRDPSATVDACRREGEGEVAAFAGESKLGAERSQLGSWAMMAARVAVESGRAPLPMAVPEGRFLLARFWMAYGRMIADGPQRAAAQRELTALGVPLLAALAAEQPDDTSTLRWIERAVAQGEAVAVLDAGRRNEGLRLLRQAADAERSLPVEFGPPALPKPSIELLAESLLALGRKAEAEDAYRAALAAAPGRRRAIHGVQLATTATP